MNKIYYNMNKIKNKNGIFTLFGIFIVLLIIAALVNLTQSDDSFPLKKDAQNVGAKPDMKENFATTFPYSVRHLPSYNNSKTAENLMTTYQAPYANPYSYPNSTLPAHVIGCGGRRGACMGGSQIPIPNTLPPVNISEQNIAPVNLTVRGFDEGIRQVGTIQKVFGNENFIYPLFGRRKYRNDNKWEYFVKFGNFGVILPIVPLRNYEELNTNDVVYIEGQKGKYRVTIYDDDIPQYLPFS